MGIGFDSEKIYRYFKGEYSDRDASYVDEVFSDQNKVKELEGLLSRQFYELLSEDVDNKKNLDHILHKIHYEINTKTVEIKERKFIRYLKWSLRLASLVILPLSVFWGVKGYLNHSLGKETFVEIKAPAWTRSHFSLPDGTTGYLNSNSSIRYNGNFNTDRRVILKGEAFFDVYKDKSRPFIVITPEVNIKVLGTRFNIASYENEKNVEVVLEEGKLVFKDNVINKSYTMKPNDLIVYDKTLRDFSIDVVQPQKYLSWTEGKLVIRNASLEEVSRSLERWYNIDVEIKGNVSQNLRLRATFVDESLEEVLYFLKRTLPVDFNIIEGGLSPDGTFIKKKVILTIRE